MPMRTHELHPSLVHAPLVLLPAAAIVDLARRARGRATAASTAPRGGSGGRPPAAALFVGPHRDGRVAGDRAPRATRARDMMFLHGIGNLALVLSAFGVAAWRSRNRAIAHLRRRPGSLAAGAAIYTAYLGGELVYSHGAGVKALGGAAAETPRSSRRRRRGGSRATPCAASLAPVARQARGLRPPEGGSGALAPIAEPGTAAAEATPSP